MQKDVVNVINRKYVEISNRVTEAYEEVFSLPCDLYFPIYDPYNETTKYRDMKIFAPHQSPTYSKEPDVTNAWFYIPYLIKKEAMNSSETEFDGYFTEGESERPFIETSKKRELPISTKVVVHQGESIIKFFVDKKLVVTGADGMMLLRMYLSPLSKDDDGEIESQEETTVEGVNNSPSTGGDNNLGVTLGATRGIETPESSKVIEEKPKRTRRKRTSTTTTRRKKKTTSEVGSIEDNLEMNIPDD